MFTLSSWTRCEPLLQKQMESGRITSDCPSLDDIRARALHNLTCLDETYTRIINPHIYKVSVSKPLRNLKREFLSRNHADEEDGE